MARLWEEMAKGFVDAVADIREKVVEEPMWGRIVTEHATPQWPEAKETQAQPVMGSITHDREAAPDRDIDR